MVAAPDEDAACARHDRRAAAARRAQAPKGATGVTWRAVTERASTRADRPRRQRRADLGSRPPSSSLFFRAETAAPVGIVGCLTVRHFCCAGRRKKRAALLEDVTRAAANAS